MDLKGIKRKLKIYDFVMSRNDKTIITYVKYSKEFDLTYEIHIIKGTQISIIGVINQFWVHIKTQKQIDNIQLAFNRINSFVEDLKNEGN